MFALFDRSLTTTTIQMEAIKEQNEGTTCAFSERCMIKEYLDITAHFCPGYRLSIMNCVAIETKVQVLGKMLHDLFVTKGKLCLPEI